MARKSRKRNRNAHSLRPSGGAAQHDAPTPGEGSPRPAITADPNDPATDGASGDRVLEAVNANGRLLRQLLEKVSENLTASPVSPPLNGADTADRADLDAKNHDPAHHQQVQQLQDEIAELTRHNQQQASDLDQRRRDIEDLNDQIADLAGQVAQSGVRQAVQSDQSSASDALSWEDRKALILQQLENDSFDAEAFVQSVGSAVQSAAGENDPPLADPVQMVNDLVDRLKQAQAELDDRGNEVGELRMLLEQQSETREGGVAIGAAAIAAMVDSDELVSQERERLQTLQDQWEAKFRQSEIDASLERAKLTRERRELAKRTETLEEELEHLRRAARINQDSSEAGTSRRWLAKLGLAGED